MKSFNPNIYESNLCHLKRNDGAILCESNLGSNTLSWKPCQGGSSKLNLPDHRYKRRCCSLIPAESDSLPHAHAQTTKTYYKHQDSRIKKAQVLKTKTSANSDIKDNSSETKLRGRLLESFQEDAKYEHVGQDTRSQGMDIKEMDRNEDKTEQNRAREQKEREKTSPTVFSDFIGPARYPLNGPGQPKFAKTQE
ncbi:hypothetical protein Tco_0853192 [Tanacetum coccineum]